MDSDLPLPRSEKLASRAPYVVKLEQPSQQQSAFYAGNPEHRHVYESSGTEVPTRPRMRLRPTTQQTEELRNFYHVNPHPTKEEREELGDRIGM